MSETIRRCEVMLTVIHNAWRMREYASAAWSAKRLIELATELADGLADLPQPPKLEPVTS